MIEFPLLMGLLLLLTIGGIPSLSLQGLLHAILTMICLFLGASSASVFSITLGAMIIILLNGGLLSWILRGQIVQRSAIELLLGIGFVVLAVIVVTDVLPPSLSRMDFSFVISIFLVGSLYSILGKTVGAQILGIEYLMNALVLFVGMKGYGQLVLVAGGIYLSFLFVAYSMIKTRINLT